MFGLVTRRRYLRDLAAERAETRRVKQVKDNFWQERDAALAAARTAARQFAEADAANKRLAGRNRALQERLEQRQDYAEAEYAVQLERRLYRLTKGTARWMAALWAERAESTKLARQVDEGNRRILVLLHDLTEARNAHKAIDGASPRPLSPSAELARALAHNRALETRLASLQAANEARDKAEYTAAGGPRFDRGQTFPPRPGRPATGWGLGGAS